MVPVYVRRIVLQLVVSCIDGPTRQNSSSTKTRHVESRAQSHSHVLDQQHKSETSNVTFLFAVSSPL